MKPRCSPPFGPVFTPVVVVFVLVVFMSSFVTAIRMVTITSTSPHATTEIGWRDYTTRGSKYSVDRHPGNHNGAPENGPLAEALGSTAPDVRDLTGRTIVSYGMGSTSRKRVWVFRHGFDRWLCPWEVDWSIGIPGVEPNRQISLTSPPVTGSDVQELQIRLKQLGFYDGSATGVFDEKTCDAVRRFQSARGSEADGIVRFDTWFALQQDASPAEEAPTRKALPPGKGRPSSGPSIPEGPVEIVVDLKTLSLTLYSGGVPVHTYPIAVGKSRTPTPVGEFKIINKKVDPGGPFGSRWMGLNIPWGIYGIHGTNRPWSIGSHASAGCIRMHNHHVAELFEHVSIGTRVIIKGKEFSAGINRVMKIGNTGEDVQYAQQVLRRMGYDAGPLDGYFGQLLQRAVLEMQSFYGLPPTGEIGEAELYVMGIR